MGNDRRIVDAARVSYQLGTKAVQSDRHLIRYLMKNHHTTPFEKVVLEFHVKVPIFVARQWLRHRTGSFNEISARYSIMKDEFYVPDPVRKQSTSNRQGSSDEAITELVNSKGLDPIDPKMFFENSNTSAYQEYEILLDQDVARELARTVLPVSLYTEFFWTVNLWNLFHFLHLRLDGHAQKEIREPAEAIVKLIKDHLDVPFAMEAFQDYILDAPKISKYELDAIKRVIGNLSDWDNERIKGAATYIEGELQQNPKMSKREKSESKLIEQLFGKEE